MSSTLETGRERYSPDRLPTQELHPVDDFVNYVREYSRERPVAVALWCFGIGFALGWRLKPW